MKNWNTLEADRDLIMNKHFTPGREGRKINKVVLHHNAGRLSIDEIWQVWQTRQASTHYQVTHDGQIGQLVWDRDTAWANGDWESNLTSISIEHANDKLGPYTISEKTLDNGAKLVAAVCKFYGLGEPEYMRNVFPHKHFSRYPTSCPGEIDGHQNKEYMNRAKKYYREMVGNVAPKANTPTTQPNIDNLVKEVYVGNYGTGDTRKKMLGNNYNPVQNRLNHFYRVRDEILGKYNPWGDGDIRKQRLTNAGLPAEFIQTMVNDYIRDNW